MNKFTFSCPDWTYAYRFVRLLQTKDDKADLQRVRVEHGVEYYEVTTRLYFRHLMHMTLKPIIDNPHFPIRESLDQQV